MSSSSELFVYDLPPITVPANASRLLQSVEAALAQPTGEIRLGWHPDDPYVRNLAFDASLILTDSHYYTGVVSLGGDVSIPTLNYIFDLISKFFDRPPRIVDIGCGQGELVGGLRSAGLAAEGFDPVLRSQGPHLYKRLWTAAEKPGELYVMRCVLPHIANPFDFLDEIAQSSPSASVLIEFQRLEWILEQAVWYQVSHDHCNLFSITDFENRYQILDKGTFNNGEWGWVLLKPGSRRNPNFSPAQFERELGNLFSLRQNTLASLAGKDLLVWGAAGKGIVLTHALVSSGANVIGVIDADSNRWGLFTEVSGKQVVSADYATNHPGTPILVANPNHYDPIAEHYDDLCELHPANAVFLS